MPRQNPNFQSSRILEKKRLITPYIFSVELHLIVFQFYLLKRKKDTIQSNLTFMKLVKLYLSDINIIQVLKYFI